jgi:hypothetical protein
MLGHTAAVKAINTPDWQVKFDTFIKQVTITNFADPPIMDEGAWLMTPTATRDHRWTRFELNNQRLVIKRGVGAGLKTWPE